MHIGNIKPTVKSKLTKNEFCDAVAIHLKDVFINHYSINDLRKYYINEFMYLVTYVGSTSDPRLLLKEFQQVNFHHILKPIAGKNDKNGYWQHQHIGYVFVDYRYSKNGYIRTVEGAHLHGFILVHPQWRKRYLKAVDDYNHYISGGLTNKELGARMVDGESRGIHLQPVTSSIDQLDKGLGYAMKNIIGNRGFYHERSLDWDMIGRFHKPKDGREAISKFPAEEDTVAAQVCNLVRTMRDNQQITIEQSKERGKREYDKLSLEDQVAKKKAKPGAGIVRCLSPDEIKVWAKNNSESLAGKLKAGSMKTENRASKAGR